MKKTLTLLAGIALAAGFVQAQETQSQSRHRPERRERMERRERPERGERAERQERSERRERQPRMAERRHHDGRHARFAPVSAEMRNQMRDERMAVRQLVDAIRKEADDAKKAELTNQLRAKLGEIADRVQAHQEERLALAEGQFTELKKRIEESKANRDSLIEEEIEHLVSGERPSRPASFGSFPFARGGAHGKGPHGMHLKAYPAPDADCH